MNCKSRIDIGKRQFIFYPCLVHLPEFFMNSSFRRTLMIATVITLGACAYNGGGKPLPQLDYQNIAPLNVSVGSVDVSTTYVPSVESSQAAAAFTTPPDVALRRYAESRLKAKGYEGSLKVVIQEASVRHSVTEADNSAMKWAGVGKQDRYDLKIRIGLTDIEPDGRQPKESSIELTRFITVPQSFSIAKRETTLRDFMQTVVREVDTMVTTALQDRMHMTVSAPGPVSPGQQGMGSPTISPAPSAPAQRVPIVQPEPLPPPW